jgi:serine protease AprX
MAPSSLPPEGQAKVKPFDPWVLDRTVIAIPLLEDMQRDLSEIRLIRELHADAAKAFNAAIELNPNYPGGAQAARLKVEQLAKDAAEQTLKTAKGRRESPNLELRSRMQKWQEELKRAIEDQRIDSKVVTVTQPGDKPPVWLVFVTLHASVIRRLQSASARDPDRPVLGVKPSRFEIIIDLNLEHPGGRDAARNWVIANIELAKQNANVRDAGQGAHLEKDEHSSQYLFARLEARAIQELVQLDMTDARDEAEKRRQLARNPVELGQIEPSRFRAIFHIWPDFEISACINKSISTVKADAAQNSFSARGAGITWAVMDTGIKQDHPHFQKNANLDPNSDWHYDFTVDGGGPFDDESGHGTHVAGIIAGEWRFPSETPEEKRPIAVSRYLKANTDDVEYQVTRLAGVGGMAPECKIVSLRVLDANGKGTVSNLIAAIAHVQKINGNGTRLLIHGVNMSLGYNFEPEWFACGQSPLCVEVDRLVKSGVVVVVAAGNTGYGTVRAEAGTSPAGLPLTINDPGNADLAITVGSTHRDMPHVYGVSYFSSKGPTGDGRLKPDLVAPGEKIISCATGSLKEDGAKGRECDYIETSGTSMAAPHVSGVIAAFLSVRREFIGQPERVKQIFLSSSTDLRRDRYFQGSGLIDLMRAIQSV